MSNFWANKVAPRPAAPAQPAQPAAPAQPWWVKGVPTRQAQPVAPVVNQPAQPVQYGSTTTSEEQSNIVDLLSQTDYQTTKAKSSLEADIGRCPGCGGPNYVGVDKQPNKMPRCYDCGYNPRFEQTMSGMVAGGGIEVTGPTRQARQQHATRNDFNPQYIIGKVNTTTR